MLELTSDVLEAARGGDREATVEILSMYYPLVWRMASGLTGREDVGKGVTKYIMQRALRSLSSWKDEGAPARWFHHNTLLMVRRTYKHPPQTETDCLLVSDRSTIDVAFIRSLRQLPMQQREAFILANGERLDPRAIAVAMDFSVLATGTHLREATHQLQSLGPEDFEISVKRMAAAYHKLGPDEEMAVQEIRQRVQRFLLPYQVGRIFRGAMGLILLFLTAWFGYWIYEIVTHSMNH